MPGFFRFCGRIVPHAAAREFPAPVFLLDDATRRAREFTPIAAKIGAGY
jgi:hypothetical protein